MFNHVETSEEKYIEKKLKKATVLALTLQS